MKARGCCSGRKRSLTASASDMALPNVGKIARALKLTEISRLHLGLVSLFVAANVSLLISHFFSMPVRQPRHEQDDAKENCKNCENYQPMENTELAHVTFPRLLFRALLAAILNAFWQRDTERRFLVGRNLDSAFGKQHDLLGSIRY